MISGLTKKREKELRKFTRLNGRFPVEFTIVHLYDGLPGIGWTPALTQNVSQEGICLEFVDIDEATLKYLHKENIHLSLRINIPPDKPPIKAVCQLAWFHDSEEGEKYTLGLEFKSVAKKDIRQILTYAQWLHLAAKIAVLIFGVAIIVFFLNGFR
ncbi:MAG: hypothetical protein ACI9F2_000128 [Lysobacterales bacterium]|jgi:hypothetical protein